MNAISDRYTLSNGVEIPCIGFGTWQMPEGRVAVGSVREAIAAGYRHIDTAQGYDNETSVGRGVKESGIPRRDIFITTKLVNSVRGYQETLDAARGSLEKLGMDYVDLFLIHWPRPVDFKDNWKQKNAESWRAFEALYHKGVIKALGISNFRPHHIDALLETAEIMPVVNQIRLAPGDTQDEVVIHSRKKGMLLEAYSPLGVGRVFEVPEMKKMAEKYGKSIAQIAIRWSLQRGYLPLPKSVTPSRIRENAQVFDFELSPEDVERIANLKGSVGYSDDPDKISW
ncbi:MAG: aldo/keto reductase [Eubacteriales bacterium]|nr:aldo/keto reductase [Eubacteriales bacterium]